MNGAENTAGKTFRKNTGENKLNEIATDFEVIHGINLSLLESVENMIEGTVQVLKFYKTSYSSENSG